LTCTLALISEGRFGVGHLPGEQMHHTKEVEILKEQAEDLAFGITSLRIKDKKHQAEESLRASEERFSAVFRFSPLAIAIVRAEDSCITDVNDYFIRATGYSRDEIIGHTTSELGLYTNQITN
jgi:PAS domain-containing protein